MIKTKPSQQGVALVMVMLISLVVAIIISGFVYTVNSHSKFNLLNSKQERALWMAETAVQRMISGLKYNNDNVSWLMASVKPTTPPTGFWLWQWNTVKDENGQAIGRYWLEIMEKTNRTMVIKAYGLSFNRTDNSGNPVDATVRVVGVKIARFSLGKFAVATNHQLGGAHFNGGARIYGGVFTSGRFHLDAASTGVFNEYKDFNTNQNFPSYNQPAQAPDSEIFVYTDPYTSPTPDPNGVIDTNTDLLGTSTAPLVAIHTKEDSTIVDPGVSGQPVTTGDGVIGNKEGGVNALKRDHTLPNVNFPDASAGGAFMTGRETEADAVGATYTGDITLGGGSATVTSIGGGTPPSFEYDLSEDNLEVNGPVYITGNVTIDGPVTWTGKGALFIEGNVTITGGWEPKFPTQMPIDHAVAVVASGDAQLGTNNGSSTHYVGFFFGNNSISIQKAKVLGNIYGNQVNFPTTGTRPDVYLEPELMDRAGVPLPDFTNGYIQKDDWWEITGSGAALPN